MPYPAFHRLRRAVRHAGAWLAAAGLAVGAAAAEPAPPLRIVGGLSGLNQYNRHEAPFWTERLRELSGGRFRAEIVPFDRAGIRAQEALGLVRLGVVPFGTALLAVAAGDDPLLAAPDLAGLAADIDTLRRSVAAFRPTLAQHLRERHGVELLALYVYPAQVAFCNAPIAGLADLAGKRVRTSSASQADWVEALGGTPVTTGFGEIVAQMKSGNLQCAITGTMSGNTIGLHELSTHVHAMPVSWGMSAFLANGAAWQALPADLRALIQRGLPQVEREIWDESARETGLGLACNAGRPECRDGRPGKLVLVPARPADEALRRAAFAGTVLPRWVARCGEACAATWNRTLAPVLGIPAPVR